MPLTYQPDVLNQLARHGLRPREETTPQVLRDALRELYKYEIRRLRAALLAGAMAKPEYAPAVDRLRRRYWLLGLPLEMWVTNTAGDG